MRVRDGAGKRRGASPDAERAPRYGLARYWQAARQPWSSLLFLTPLMSLHLLGVWATRSAGASDVLAVEWSARLLRQLGASGVWAPPALVFAGLLVWALRSRGRPRPAPVHLPLMLLESALLTLPLLVLMRVPLAVGGLAGMASAVGAGIYEEVIFRAGLLGGMVWLVSAWRPTWRQRGLLAALVISSIAFSASHFAPFGALPLSMAPAVRLCLAGLYLGLIFLGRGLGIVAGTHVAYNVVLVLASPEA